MAIMYIGKNKVVIGGGEAASNGKVKLNEDGELKYLQEYLDNITIDVVDDKIVIKGIGDLSSEDLNNLKDKIDSIELDGIYYKGEVNTKAELDTLEDVEEGYLKIVINDESNNGNRTSYIYNGTSWNALNGSNIEIRDFNDNPINLENEVTGVLSQDNIDLTNIAKKEEIRNFNDNPIDLENEVTGILPQDKMDLTDIVKKDEINNYLDKATYDTDNDGIIDKAKTLEGLNKTIEQLNKGVTYDDLQAGDNVEITKNDDGTITISMTGNNNKNTLNLDSLPYFGV